MRQMTIGFKILALGCLLMAGSAQLAAQTIYRIVGADGKVTFSDKPPPDATKATATSASGRPIGSTEVALPFELRQVVARYPVTLYSAASCVPCNAGRMLLQSRGVPFVEHGISTPDDSEALQRISGELSLPFLTVGGQKIKGFSEAEWTQFLNAANYPQTSVLPANYRNPPAKPLVAVQKPPAAKTEDDAQARNDDKNAEGRPAAAPPAAATANPSGIRF
ncbi:MAG: glutaredoxin family protein [Rhodoferax sp.]|nr:glutaredoxin family protein [Rhodoferax sp.]